MLRGMLVDSCEDIAIDRSAGERLQRQWSNKLQRVTRGRHAYFSSGFTETANQLRNLIGGYAATDAY